VFHSKKNLPAVLWLPFLMLAAGCGGGAGEADKTDQAAGDGGGKASVQAAGTASDPNHPVVVIDTSLGKITVELDREKAERTVDNFLRYVQSGHYDRTIVHQVLKGRAVLAGGYGQDYIEKPTRAPIENEAYNGLKNTRGTIAMARLPDEIHSAKSQFFINLADNVSLDHQDRTPEGYGYCVFGRVIEGMDAVDRIAAVEVYDRGDFDRTPVERIDVHSIREQFAPAQTAAPK